jgi:hypothetical protein
MTAFPKPHIFSIENVKGMARGNAGRCILIKPRSKMMLLSLRRTSVGFKAALT